MPRCASITLGGTKCKALALVGKVKCRRHVRAECAICMEDVSSMNTHSSKRLECGHSFHIDCILGWFKESSVCPVCRSNNQSDVFIQFKNGIEENMREKYMDAIRSLESEVEEYRLRF